jgi:hypothetical protein
MRVCIYMHQLLIRVFLIFYKPSFCSYDTASLQKIGVCGNNRVMKQQRKEANVKEMRKKDVPSLWLLSQVSAKATISIQSAAEDWCPDIQAYVHTASHGSLQHVKYINLCVLCLWLSQDFFYSSPSSPPPHCSCSNKGTNKRSKATRRQRQTEKHKRKNYDDTQVHTQKRRGRGENRMPWKSFTRLKVTEATN